MKVNIKFKEMGCGESNSEEKNTIILYDASNIKTIDGVRYYAQDRSQSKLYPKTKKEFEIVIKSSIQTPVPRSRQGKNSKEFKLKDNQKHEETKVKLNQHENSEPFDMDKPQLIKVEDQ